MIAMVITMVIVTETIKMKIHIQEEPDMLIKYEITT